MFCDVYCNRIFENGLMSQITKINLLKFGVEWTAAWDSHVTVTVWYTGARAAAAENACEMMEVVDSSSLTAVANRSLDLSRSLTEKITAAADGGSDSDDDGDNIVTSVSRDTQVYICRLMTCNFSAGWAHTVRWFKHNDLASLFRCFFPDTSDLLLVLIMVSVAVQMFRPSYSSFIFCAALLPIR